MTENFPKLKKDTNIQNIQNMMNLKNPHRCTLYLNGQMLKTRRES